MLLLWAQEAHRSGKERSELVRSEVQSSPLAGEGTPAPIERDRGRIERYPRRQFGRSGFLDSFERAHLALTGPGESGASPGFLPGPDDAFRAGQDLQTALFGYMVSDESRRFSVGAGHQWTWHEDETERFLASQPEILPAPSTALLATVRMDWTTSGNELEGSWPELSQLAFNASHRTPDGHGLGLFAARSRFSHLRVELDGDPAGIASSFDDRFGIDGWLALGSSLQLYGRAEQWSDRDDSGETLRARATWRDAFGPGGPLLFETYVGTSQSSHTTGLRASGRKRFEFGAIGLSWDWSDHDQQGLDDKLLQHAARADVDFALGRHWSLGLYAESQFGERQDALSLGFTLRLGSE